MTISRRTLPLLLALPALAFTACGSKSDSDKIKGIVQDVAKDSSTICDHASDKLLATLGSGGVEGCKKAARGYPDTNPDKIKGDIAVKVDGDAATADFTGSDGKKHHVTFVKDGGDWKVDTST